MMYGEKFNRKKGIKMQLQLGIMTIVFCLMMIGIIISIFGIASRLERIAKLKEAELKAKDINLDDL